MSQLTLDIQDNPEISQLQQQPFVNEQAVAQSEFNHYVQQQSIPQYEIDSIPDVFGALYRVWGGEKGIHLLGTFYQNLDGRWVSQPCYSDERLNWKTSDEAVAAIVSA